MLLCEKHYKAIMDTGTDPGDRFEKIQSRPKIRVSNIEFVLSQMRAASVDKSEKSINLSAEGDDIWLLHLFTVELTLRRSNSAPPSQLVRFGL